MLRSKSSVLLISAPSQQRPFQSKPQVSLKNSKDALQRSLPTSAAVSARKRTVNDLFPLSDAAVSGFLDEGFFILKHS